MFSASMRSIARPRLLLVALLLIAQQFWASLPARAAADTAPFRIMVPLMLMSAPEPAPDTAVEQQALALTNALRQQNGCSALQLSPELSTAARGHSQDMADNNYFNHIDLKGDTPKMRAQQAGYAGSAGTENIA